MSKSIFNLTLDIHNPAPQCSVSVRLGDTGRRLSVRFVENGKPITLASGTFVMFVAKKPDGNEVYDDCTCDLVGGSVIYDVGDQVTTAPGIVRCQFEIFGPDGGAIASPTMEIVVRESFFNEEKVISKSDYDGISAWWGAVNEMNNARAQEIAELGERHDDELKALDERTVKYTDVVNSIGEDASGKTDVPLSANAGYRLSYKLSEVIKTHGEDVDSLQSEIDRHAGKLDDHKEALDRHGEDIAGVKSIADELKGTKLDASVYNQKIPKIEGVISELDLREATNNQARMDQCDDLTREIADLWALLDGKDLNLDQIYEIVEYIKRNREEIDQWAGRYVSKLDIADNLLTTVAGKVLSARAGYELHSMMVGLRSSYYALDARMPEVSDEDEGKFAVVVNGAWAAVSMTDVSEVAM